MILSFEDNISILKKRMNFFHDVIKTCSLYLEDSINIIEKRTKTHKKIDEYFTNINSYLNYNLDNLKLDNDSKDKISNFLNDFIYLHMHIKKRPAYETRQMIDECINRKRNIINLINTKNFLFEV